MIKINIIKNIKVKTYLCMKEEHINMSTSEDIDDLYFFSYLIRMDSLNFIKNNHYVFYYFNRIMNQILNNFNLIITSKAFIYLRSM